MKKKHASRCSQKHIFQKTTFQRTKKRQRHSFWRDAFPPNSDRTRSHPTLTTHVPTHFAARTGKAKEQTKKSLNVQERNVFPAAARSTFLKNTHLKQRRIITQSVKKSSKNRQEIMHNSLTKHKKIMNKSWKNHEKIMNESWTNHEQIMKQSWTNHKKFIKQSA